MFPEAIWLMPDTMDLPKSVLAFLNTLSAEEILLKKEAAERYSLDFIGMECANQSNLLKIIR